MVLIGVDCDSLVHALNLARVEAIFIRPNIDPCQGSSAILCAPQRHPNYHERLGIAAADGGIPSLTEHRLHYG